MAYPKESVNRVAINQLGSKPWSQEVFDIILRTRIDQSKVLLPLDEEPFIMLVNTNIIHAIANYILLCGLGFSSVGFARSAGIDDSILMSATYLDSGEENYWLKPGFLLSLEAPVTFIPKDKSLGEFSDRRPPVASVPGIRLGYGLGDPSQLLFETCLSAGSISLKNDPFNKVDSFDFQGRRLGIGLGIAKSLADLTLLLGWSEQWTSNRVRGGLIIDDITSSLHARSETTAFTVQAKLHRMFAYGSRMSRVGEAEFRVFDQGTALSVNQDGSVPLVSAGLGYQDDSFRVNVEKNVLKDTTQFYQVTYTHSWSWQ